LLDAFRHHYNKHRPHQGIADATPAERYEIKPTDLPPPPPVGSEGSDEFQEPVYPPHSILRKVTPIGLVGYERKGIYVGKRWAGARVRVIPIGELIHIYYGDQLIRVLTPDPNVYYQGFKGGGRRR